MDFLSYETECKMFAYLRDVGCCVSCSLRFVGTRSLEIFQEPAESAAKMKYMSQNDDRKEDRACTACLGILQDVTQETAVTKMLTTIENGGYDCPTFNCAMTLPICLFLRERSIQVALTEQFQLTDSQKTLLKLRTQSIKEIWKYRVLGQVEKSIGKQLVAAPNPSPLLLEIFFSYCDDENETKLFSRSNSQRNQCPKFSRKTMETALAGMTDITFQEYCKVPPSNPKTFIEIQQLALSHAGICIGGRYAKFSRELSQTPWFINGEKKMETSVQDLICGSMIEMTKSDSVKFLSSGREDVDVRNIYSGRPFAVELINPRVTLLSDKQLDRVVSEINESTDLVQITTKLKILDAADLIKLKEGENKKTKFYRALCTIKSASRDLVKLDKLADIKDLEITQKTPLRVLHRRPLVPRPRLVHAMRSRWLTPEETKNIKEGLEKSGVEDTSHIEDLFVLDVKTQAGTYVKEFIHGDFGRTRPNLCEILGVECDIPALDVTAINLDWP